MIHSVAVVRKLYLVSVRFGRQLQLTGPLACLIHIRMYHIAEDDTYDEFLYNHNVFLDNSLENPEVAPHTESFGQACSTLVSRASHLSYFHLCFVCS